MLRRLLNFSLLSTIAVVVAGTSPGTAAEKEDAKAPTMAVFTFGGQITEAPLGDDFLFATSSESFKDLLARLKKVEKDETAKGVVLLVSDVSLGRSQIEEVRQVLHQIKAAGKEVVAHADSMSMGTYLLLSAANRISVVPTGDIWINGLYGESPYLRELLDKLGIKPDYQTCGNYKSAGEMFMRNGPSPAAQENLDWLMDGIFDAYLRLIAEGRNVDVAQVRAWIDHGIYSAEAAKEAGIIDDVQYRQGFVDDLKKKYGDDLVFDKKFGKEKGLEIDFSSPLGILKFYGELLSGPKKKDTKKDAIAIVYVEGVILPGASDPSGFPFLSGGIAYSTPIAKALDKAADDENIKAVVLRVDSPGGSAVASEIILNATKRVAAKKPFVVSMGNVAGSGGYYVACGTQTIFADSTTITGSIGVVSGKFATTNMWNKIGVHWSAVKRGANAGMLASDDVFTEQQRDLMQNWMDEIYGVFKGHVVAVRGEKLSKSIDELAGGRVYTGKQALELGLIDKLGGLDDAIEFAAKEAKLEDYDVRVIPRPKGLMEMLMSDLQGGDTDNKTLSLAVQRISPAPASLIEMALPELKALEPRRLRSVLAALKQMELMQDEHVMTAMPVIDIRD